MADVKKKIRPGAIELHPDELALVVHYEVQEVVQQADGSQEVISSSQATKKVTVKSLNERTDLPALAGEVVDKCKLIHPSKVGQVQDLLQQLQQRQQQQQSEAAGPPAAPFTPPQQRPSSSSSSRPESPAVVWPHQQQQPQQYGKSVNVPANRLSNSRPDSGTNSPIASRPPSASGRPQSAPRRPQSASGRPSSGSSNRPSPAYRGSSPQQQQQEGLHGTAAFDSGGGSTSSSPSRIARQQQQQQQQQQRVQPYVMDQEAAAMAQQQQQLQQRTIAQASEIFKNMSKSQPPAFVDELETHLEGLYEEDLNKRAAAAAMICQLFRSTVNLQVLLGRETLLPTLARLLREDGLKSLELATAVAGCFFACSCLKQLHRMLLDNQVGTLLMDLVSLELQRSSAREAQEGPAATTAAITARAAAASLKAAPPLDNREMRVASLVVRQDRFLYVATACLLHLAEDTSVQRKMRKKDIVGLLVGMLSRPHVELLLLAAGFLRRLCVYAEDKDRLASFPGVVPKLLALVQPGCGEQLQSSVLRLLHNLSFDACLRQQMVQGGLVPLAVNLLDSPKAAPLAAGLLYQLSLEDEARSMFAYCPGALPRLHESIMRAMGAGPAASAAGSVAGLEGCFAGFTATLSGSSNGRGDLRRVPELIALAVNLAHNRRTAEWFCGGERLERLLKRSLAAADELAWKLLHNLAVMGGQQMAGRILMHAKAMMALLQSPTTGPELFVEVLGTLASAADALSGNDSADGSSSCGGSVGQYVSLGEVMGLLQACFAPGALEDDALLEAVVLLGALTGQPEFDQAIADSGLLMRLVELIASKRTDDEFVLQVCWAFSRSLMQPATSQALLSMQQVVPYLVDLLHDNCLAVRHVASGCLDVIMDTADEALAGTIRSLKFEAHNQEWLGLAGPHAQNNMAAAIAAAEAGVDWLQRQQQQHQQSDMGSRRPGSARRSTQVGSASGASYRDSQHAAGQYSAQYQDAPADEFSEQDGSSHMRWLPSEAGVAATVAGMGAAGGASGDPAAAMALVAEPSGSGNDWQQGHQRSSMIQAGEQRMVLDLEDFVGGVDSELDGGYGVSNSTYSAANNEVMTAA